MPLNSLKSILRHALFLCILWSLNLIYFSTSRLILSGYWMMSANSCLSTFWINSITFFAKSFNSPLLWPLSFESLSFNVISYFFSMSDSLIRSGAEVAFFIIFFSDMAVSLFIWSIFALSFLHPVKQIQMHKNITSF